MSHPETNPGNEKSPGRPSKGSRKALNSAKPTSANAQHKRIIQALRRRPQTSYDLRRLGCYQCPARIKELRDKFNFGISTDPVTIFDRDGYEHRGVALYSLVSEPPGDPLGILVDPLGDGPLDSSAGALEAHGEWS